MVEVEYYECEHGQGKRNEDGPEAFMDRLALLVIARRMEDVCEPFNQIIVHVLDVVDIVPNGEGDAD